MSKTELYIILNELIIENWLSISFKNPEILGIFPKPLNFSDRFKFIFFDAAKIVFEHLFRIEPLENLGQFNVYYDLERINKFINTEKENIYHFYDILLNIDVSVYN